MFPKSFLLLCLLPAFGLAGEEHPRVFKHSAVVSMYAGTPELLQLYGITWRAWGGKSTKEYIDQMHAIGVKNSASVGFRTELRHFMKFDENFMDGICRDIDGQPTKVRDWIDLKKEYPYYWGCTNNPRYQEFLRERALLAMSAKPDALHFDDYRGTSAIALSFRCGGFCDSCTAKFREYLRENIDQQKLRDLGIENLDDFRYDKFLAARGFSAGDYRKAKGKAPLYEEFQHFHIRAAVKFVEELRDYAREVRGQRIPFACNCNPITPENLAFAPLLDYFSCEVPHGAQDRRCDSGPIFTYKIGDWLGKPVASTASGHDWAFVKEHNLPGIVRTWIPLSYAFGHCLMAPHNQWCFNQEKLSHWYRSEPEDYAHIYRFIRRNASLFDNYEAIASVALLYSNPDFRRGQRLAVRATSWLADHNIPFAIVAAGDGWLDAELTQETVSGYAALIVPMPTVLDGDQKKVVDKLAASGKVVAWDRKKGMDEAHLSKVVPQQVKIEGAENVMAVPRAIKDQPDAPAILHLLNRNYDAAIDDMKKLSDFKVMLHKSLFSDRNFAKATLYSPPATLDRNNPGASEPVEIELETSGDHTTLTIPELSLWAIIKLEE